MLDRLVLLLLTLLYVGAGCSSRPPGIAEEDYPPPFARTALNFIVVGDWGRDGFFNQDDVAEQMGITADSIQARFVISTGDNFYPSGVDHLNDFKFVTSFERIYTAPSLDVPWYTVLGNHDWQGDVDVQIAYSAYNDRWTMPSRYYSVEVAIDDTTDALLVFADTTPIADADRRRLYPQSDRWDAERQVAWIDSTLGASDAAWEIVIGHHPIYVASAKYEDNANLIRELLPILKRHGVRAYFAGHDHNLQHLRDEDGDIDYFISGAGSLTRGVDADDPRTLFALRVPGFLAVSLNPKQMFVQAIDENGVLHYFANVPVGLPSAGAPEQTSPGMSPRER